MFKAAALAIAVLLPGTAAAEWTMLRSPHFVYIGDASVADIRAVASRMEQFREVMLRTVSNAPSSAPAVPTTVVVFRHRDAFRPYMPIRDGALVEVGGYFVSGPYANYIALYAGGPEVEPAIFHEYTHFLISGIGIELPLWLNEGIAEVYETFDTARAGRLAIIGTPGRAQLDALNFGGLLPVAELNAVTQSSPVYESDLLRGRFYAQSWALTRYLQTGSEARRAQLADFLVRLERGEASEAAFKAAFGDPRLLDRELQTYIQVSRFAVSEIDLGARIVGSAAGPPQTVADDDVQGYLGDLVAQMHGSGAGRDHLRKTLVAWPGAFRASGALGVLELRESNLDTAIGLLDRAVQGLPKEASYQSALGRALFIRSREVTVDEPLAENFRDRARQALSAAWDLLPVDAEVAAMLSYLEKDPARAIPMIRQAIALEPTRDHYRLHLATLLVRSRDLAAASEVADQLMARGRTPEVRAEARKLAGEVAALRGRTEDR